MNSSWTGGKLAQKPAQKKDVAMLSVKKLDSTGALVDVRQRGHGHEEGGSRPLGPSGVVPASDWSDARLVQSCLDGHQHAWTLLIERYKHLIYSFPRRYGASHQDAADVFQLVCAELFVSLPQLRNQQSVRAWMMTVAAHQAYYWKRKQRRRLEREDPDADVDTAAVAVPALPLEAIEDAERAQTVRDALVQLSPRCRALVRMLFFEDPPVPYQVAAARLGMAPGSVCFIRARCLKKLERVLRDAGLRL